MCVPSKRLLSLFWHVLRHIFLLAGENKNGLQAAWLSRQWRGAARGTVDRTHGGENVPVANVVCDWRGNSEAALRENAAARALWENDGVVASSKGRWTKKYTHTLYCQIEKPLIWFSSNVHQPYCELLRTLHDSGVTVSYILFCNGRCRHRPSSCNRITKLPLS